MDEGERIAREAEALLPGKKRMPWIIIGQAEKWRGRYEEAIQAFEHAKTIETTHIPALNRRMCAVLDKDLAVLQAELGRNDEALALIHGAEAELAADPKLSVTLDSAAALVLAHRQEREPALARIESAEAGRARVPEDGTTQRSASTCSAGLRSCSTSPNGRRPSCASTSTAGRIPSSTPMPGTTWANAGGGWAT